MLRRTTRVLGSPCLRIYDYAGQLPCRFGDSALRSRGTSSTTYTGHCEVVIALGSNQGGRVDNLLAGLAGLGRHAVEVLRVSLLYETAPQYVTEQPAYLNAAVLAHTDLSPLQLLYHLKKIEKAAGRDMGGARFGPRPLDLDIIFHGSLDYTHEALSIPHARWAERSFVKAPVADLLLPEDIDRGYIVQREPQGSVLNRLQQLVQQWEAEGGESQVGAPGLCRVMPIHRQIWELGHSTHICGILNVTPDSFSDGGRFLEQRHQQHARTAQEAPQLHSQSTGSASPAQQQQQQQAVAPAQPAHVTGSTDVDVVGAVEAARALADAGAQLIDVGGQSTRPGSQRLSAEEELARIMPVIRGLRDCPRLVHVPVSVDTYHADVAEAAVAAGADMVNDVTGGTHDAMMLPVVAQLGVPLCIMHLREDLSQVSLPQQPLSGCVWREVGNELRARAAAAVAAGILPWNLVLDPGLGFAKAHSDSAALLGGLAAMRRDALRGVWGRLPLLVGPSRKRFIGELTGRVDPAERDLGTAAACVAAVAQGADIVRVHNVAMVSEAMRVADGIFRGTWPIAAKP